MIRLGNTTQKLQAILSGAVSSTEADIVTSYRDEITTTQSQIRSGGASTLTTSAGAAAVDIVAAPSQEQMIRVVEFISVRNNDTAAITLTLRYNDNGTTYKIITATLSSGDTLFYTTTAGFYIVDSNGQHKVTSDPLNFTWTPVLTFGTPGDLSVTYTVQSGTGVKDGTRVFLDFHIDTATFTHTTASGNCTITGNPYTAVSLAGSVIFNGSVAWEGITKANYTQVNLRIADAASSILLSASGSGQAAATIATTDMPTGGNVILRGSINFQSET